MTSGAEDGDPARFAFQCPRQWSSLLRTNRADVRFCGECAQPVYLVTTAADAKRRAVANQCVALARPETPSPWARLGAALRAIVRGRAPLPPAQIFAPPPTPAPRVTTLGKFYVGPSDWPPLVGWLVELTGEHRGRTHVFRDGSHPVDGVPGLRIVASGYGFTLNHEHTTALRVNGKETAHHELVDNDRLAVGELELIWKDSL